MSYMRLPAEGLSSRDTLLAPSGHREMEEISRSPTDLPQRGSRQKHHGLRTPPPSPYLDEPSLSTNKTADVARTQWIRRHARKIVCTLAMWLLVGLSYQRVNMDDVGAFTASSLANIMPAAVSNNNSVANSVQLAKPSLEPVMVKQTIQEITIVASWLGDNADDKHGMNRFPAWLNSLANQPIPINLIWVNFYSDETPGCLNISSYASGWDKIRQICVHRDVFYEKIAESLCKSWECTPTEVDRVLTHMEHLNDNDDNLVLMRPFLGHFLRDHIKTDWWAWIDSDITLGDLSRNFPYDIMEMFDIITIGDTSRESIYLHGQFTAFRKSAMIDHLHQVTAYSSPEEFIEKMKPDHNAEERYWSNALLLNERVRMKLDWLQVKGRHNDLRDGERLVSYRNRVIRVPLHATRLQVEALLEAPAQHFPSITEKGVTVAMNRSHTGAEQCRMWDPITFCPLLSIDEEQKNRVYWMRRNGDYQMRLEPLSIEAQPHWHDEYFHFHRQCSKEWIRLPTAAFLGGYADIVFDYQARLVEAWRKGDSAATLFRQSKPKSPPEQRGGFWYCPW